MKRWLAFGGTAGLSAFFLLDLCNWLYACGCRHWLAGAVTACNIHHAQGPHCAWCAMGATGFWSLFAGIIAVQALIVWLPRRPALVWRAALALLSFPALAWLSTFLL
ncbi:MAG: hypothetical protein K2X03_04775 [Bryobacteraceae bacterium]|nr:hypothetical protein [Bryobacteraceae bacterium]